MRGRVQSYLKAHQIHRMDPPALVRFYRRMRSARIRRRRLKTNPRWVIHAGIHQRTTGASEAFARSVRRAFDILNLPRAVVNVDRLIDTLESLAARPSDHRDASAYWRDTLAAIPAGALQHRQWRWLSQISGMMGLFRATDVARLKSAEMLTLGPPDRDAAPDGVLYASALLLLGRTAEAAEWLAARRAVDPESVAVGVSAHFATRLLHGSSSDTRVPDTVGLDGHLSRLRPIVEGRSVAIIGNSKALTATAVPDDVEVVVRLNAFKILDRAADQIHAGRRLVVYMNSGQSGRLLAESNDCTPAADALTKRSSLSALRATPPAGAPHTFTNPRVAPPIHDHGPVIGNQAVFDCVVCGASSIQLVGFDFNQTSLIDETPWQMCRKLGDQGALNQFQFARSLREEGLLRADAIGNRALSLDPTQYASLLEDLYGDWSTPRT
jgi:hypothetical protein